MITIEQAISKYGEVKLKFSSYYKYSFMFQGRASDGALICANFGGNSDDIYRYEVDADKTYFLGDIKSNWHGVDIRIGEDKIFEYYDY